MITPPPRSPESETRGDTGRSHQSAGHPKAFFPRFEKQGLTSTHRLAQATGQEGRPAAGMLGPNTHTVGEATLRSPCGTPDPCSGVCSPSRSREQGRLKWMPVVLTAVPWHLGVLAQGRGPPQARRVLTDAALSLGACQFPTGCPAASCPSNEPRPPCP